MAEVLGKTNLFSYCNQNQQNKSIYVVPKSCGGSCLVRGCFPSMKLKSEGLRLSASLNSDFYGNRVVFQENKGMPKRGISSKSSINAQALQTGLIGKAQKWWEKGMQPNMKEVTSAQELVDSLSNAGDKLVIVDFFSPGCGGCKALHPKICQLAEMHPDVQFLQVNYEEQKSMCYSLNVHVLPFFRFYRGAHGRLCSFSCTNATDVYLFLPIKKFKDALAKHTTDRCSLGPTTGLEEKELLALAANKGLNFNYTPKPQRLRVPVQEEIAVAEASPSHSNSNLPLPLHSTPLKSAQDTEEKTLVTAGR
ncbi:hypothetical protein JRO89_XS04G0131600 [Xanthoceras sorbifolium]|uniref:Thioredoxin domain-containing protein n=1 Tax=Xanthoceras sorbifolium TaxID=99658 RepID=A0ABQ8I538_9ROSI|nr:hypothetical protein JRO89_XS04G0131600 [Xanthoceras sorbifolium]